MQAVAKSQKIKKSTSTKVFYVICYTFVALMALVCLLPFIMVVSGSFSSEQAIRFQGYGILPREFTTAAYAAVKISSTEMLCPSSSTLRPCLTAVWFAPIFSTSSICT